MHETPNSKIRGIDPDSPGSPVQPRFARRRLFLLSPKSRRAGSSIIEALVASSLVVIGIIGIVQLVTRSLAANDAAADRFVAAHLAAEGVEITRNYLEGLLAASSTSGGRSWGDLWTVLDNGAYEAAPNLPGILRPIASPTSMVPLDFDLNVSPYYGYYGPPALPTKFYRTITVEWSAPCPGPNSASKSVGIRAAVNWTSRNIPASLEVADELHSWRGTPVCTNP